MSKAPGILGHSRIDYPIVSIMLEACNAYREASSAFDKYEKIYDTKKDVTVLPDFFNSQATMAKQGTIAIVMAVTALDGIIYQYACHFLHHEDVDKLFRNMGFVKKWIIAPEKAENKRVSHSNTAIKQLENLVAARNAIIHQKTDWITVEGFTDKSDPDEWKKFRAAAYQLKTTYELCINILKQPKPIPGGTPLV